MAGGKETPRQKMISMMYLVLTALLALNVSVDILDAFAIVNDGIETSNASVEKKIKDYYVTFEQQYEKQPEKAADYWNKAQEIRTKTDEMINYIESEIKLPLVQVTEEVTKEEIFNPKDEKKSLIRNKDKADPAKNRRIFHEFDLKNISAKDKYDAPTNFMINEGNATELRNKIEEYRLYVINTLQSAGISDYGNIVGLRTDGDYYDANNNKLTWEQKNFYHVILAADIAILNKIIGEIQTTEFDAISELFKRIGATDYKFNALEAKVFPKTTYVLQGQDFEADIFIAASDTTRKFDAKYARGVKDFSRANANAVQKVSSKNGVVSIKIPTNAEGEQSFAGIVELADPETGEIVPYPFQSSYTVAPPSATVAPTQMMILYQGLKNPISVSAPGISNDKIDVTISKGKIEKGNQPGLYMVEVSSGDKNVTITASTNINGKKVILGTHDFRVKRVPSPEAKIGGISSGKIAKDELQAAGGIIPDMGDFEFGDFQYNVMSYTLGTLVGGDYKSTGTIKGGRFNQEVNDMIKSAKKGQKLFFENIQAKGPDGVMRTLNPINVEIK
ncbi:MAG: gliding motility protein GldM [Bacteroidales bacterium]|nr:gliding motility protein GldM [Bacteroidales bacterium]